MFPKPSNFGRRQSLVDEGARNHSPLAIGTTLEYSNDNVTDDWREGDGSWRSPLSTVILGDEVMALAHCKVESSDGS